MGVITGIEQQKNKNRVNIFVDDSFFCGIGKETAVIFGLKEGKEVDENFLKNACFESEVKRAFEKAGDYLGVRMHSKSELEKKLAQKGFEENVISRAIERLEEYHYIDDNLFAKTFVEANSKYPKRTLENKLLQRGVAKNVIKEALAQLSNDDEIELCKKYIEKYKKSKSVETLVEKQKMVASLLRKGFSFDVIKRSSKELDEIEE